MKITAYLVSPKDPIQADLDTLENTPKIIQSAGREVHKRRENDALEALRFYPRKAKLPFQFATEKSMRWYMAAVRGRIPGVVIPTQGNRYKRTGGFADSIYFEGRDIEKGFEFAAGSTWENAEYVAGKNRQVPGHTNTGWPRLVNTINSQFKTVETEMEDELQDAYRIERKKNL